MKILMFRPTWGIPLEEWRALFRQAKELGFDGIEFNLHRAGPTEGHADLKKLLDDLGLKVIIQTFSSWVNYEGPRPPGLSPQDHLEMYRSHLSAAKVFDPILINCQSGCDFWSREDSIAFYHGTFQVDRELGFSGKVCHETHRNRSLFHPFFAAEIVKAVPELRLTADLSHWTCVCERLLDVSPEDVGVLNGLIPNMYHIHARVGTTQSSQCPDPTDPGYAPELRFFEESWKKIIKANAERGDRDWISVMPEYGIYPYMPLHHPTSHSDLANSEGKRLRSLLQEFATSLTA